MTGYNLNTKVRILGEEWRVQIRAIDADDRLECIDAFTDKTSRLIVIGNVNPNETNLDYPVEYLKKLIRHEVIHAFMFESGLAENWTHEEMGQEELTVDWFAIQFHKIQAVLDELYPQIKEI